MSENRMKSYKNKVSLSSTLSPTPPDRRACGVNGSLARRRPVPPRHSGPLCQCRSRRCSLFGSVLWERGLPCPRGAQFPTAHTEPYCGPPLLSIHFVRCLGTRFQGLDNEGARRGRQTASVELRKNKRVDQLSKRRNMVASAPTVTPLGESNEAVAAPEAGGNIGAQLPEIITGIKSGIPDTIYNATKKCRMLLSKERNPPIQEVIESGLVPVFVQMLACDDNSPLQFEAAWGLTNIASGASEQTMAVVQANAVPAFIRLLSSPNMELREQSVWALGNIAGDCPQLRDYVISQGVLQPLIDFLMTADAKITMLRNGTWTLSNMCRGKNPAPNFESIKACIPTMARLLHHHDQEVMTDAAWALSYLTDGDNDKIQAVVNAGVVKRLIELLANKNTSVITPALRAIGNIVTGTDSQTQCVLDNGGLRNFGGLLQSPKENIRKETCWTISNITAGSEAQIQAVCDSNLIPQLISLLDAGDFRTRKEAAWAISNLTSGGNKNQIYYLVHQGVIKPFSDLLSVQDGKLIEVLLDATSNILKAGQNPVDGTNEFADFYDQAGGMEMIEQLQNHENEKIYEKSLNIIETYFGDEDDEEDLQIVPTTSVGNGGMTFNFAPAAPVANAGNVMQFAF